MPNGELIANKTSALVADSADGAHLFASARSLGVDAGELFRRACSMASEAPAARTGAFNRRHARSRRVLPGDACARGKWWLRRGAGHDHIDRVVSARSRSLRPIVAFPKKVSGQESRQMSRACRCNFDLVRLLKRDAYSAGPSPAAQTLDPKQPMSRARHHTTERGEGAT